MTIRTGTLGERLLTLPTVVVLGALPPRQLNDNAKRAGFSESVSATMESEGLTPSSALTCIIIVGLTAFLVSAHAFPGSVEPS